MRPLFLAIPVTIAIALTANSFEARANPALGMNTVNTVSGG